MFLFTCYLSHWISSAILMVLHHLLLPLARKRWLIGMLLIIRHLVSFFSLSRLMFLWRCNLLDRASYVDILLGTISIVELCQVLCCFPGIVFFLSRGTVHSRFICMHIDSMASNSHYGEAIMSYLCCLYLFLWATAYPQLSLAVSISYALRPEFESLRGQLLHHSPLPTLNDALKELLAEETRLGELGIISSTLPAFQYLQFLGLHLLLCGNLHICSVLLSFLWYPYLIYYPKGKEADSVLLFLLQETSFKSVGRIRKPMSFFVPSRTLP